MERLRNTKLESLIQNLDKVDYLSIFNELSDGVIVTNADGVIVYYNKAMSRIDELPVENVISRKVTEVYDLDDSTSIIMQCLSDKKLIIDKHIFYRTRMGKFANTIHNAIPVFNKEELVGVFCLVRDYNTLVHSIASIPRPEKEQVMSTSAITFEKIIGEDPAFKNAINSARMAASTPSPVMLFGETGTGKELFARAIHNHSPRKSEKYTPVNCAAIPENLLEGILFGTSKGAFTGAVEKAGLFERTNKGTIFLDEINSMPVGLQSKILRSIQESKVRRVGALKEIKTDLKIISSLNRDPHISIAEGTFRSDLFYRLGVVFIHIVPLRERLGDLELLVNHFIKKHSALLFKNVRGISEEVMALFKNYNWPGNVRELEHVIEGAMNIVGSDEIIRFQHLQPRFSQMAASSNLKIPSRRSDDQAIQKPLRSFKPAKLENEAEMVKNTLSENSGNVAKTARNLGISRQLLYYKMKKYGIERSDVS